MISLEDAKTIIRGALKKGRELELNPLCVVVLDPGGHPVALVREDRSSNLRPGIATGKANGALALGVPSSKIGDMALERPHFVASLHTMTPGGVVPAAGGINIQDKDGNRVGAVGVTGDVSENDEICALAGIADAGLVAEGY